MTADGSDHPSLADALSQDAARIGAELTRLDGGTDPFAAAVRTTRMPMIITDPRQPNNPTIFVNDSFCRLTGYAREEIIGRNCRFLQGPESDPATIRRISQALRAAEAIEIDIRNYRKNGEAFWNRLLVAPVRDRAGEVAYFFASQVDVTLERERMAGLESRNAALMAELADRARAQEEAATRLRLAIEAGRLGEWELDLASDTSVRASRHDEIFGYGTAVPEWGFRTFINHVLPVDRARVQAEFQRVVDTGAGWHIECRIRRADDGEIRWIRIQSAPVPGVDGRPIKLVGLVQDITDTRRAQDAMREINRTLEQRVAGALAERKLLADLVDGTDAFVQVVGLDWRILAINHAASRELARIYGVRPKVGDHLPDLLADYPEHRAAVEAVWARGLAGEEFTEVGEFGGPDLERRAYEMKFNTLRDAGGRTIGTYMFAYDVTDRIRNARRLDQAEETLRQSQKMEALGQLTGGMAHDFNNMLQGVSSALQLMERRIEAGRPEQARRFVEAARQQVDRAAALTHRLLAFARRQALAPERVELDALVSGIAELIRRTVGPAVTVEFRPRDGVWPVRCDANGLENVLLNLAINARDAMPHGGGITISTDHVTLGEADVAGSDGAAPGDYVRLTVADAGAGMTPDVLAHAFEPFFTTKPAGKGTGLGLSQVYGFVRQSGGVVRLESEPGRGTKVHLFLARVRDAHPEATGPDNDREQAREPRVPTTATVLLVEDEPAVRAFAGEVLRDLGIEVLEAADGASGLATLRAAVRDGERGGVDVLVADVGLPGGLNGRQLADAARELLPRLPVLLITGYAGDAISNGDLPAGLELLAKPFTLEALSARVCAMLDPAAGVLRSPVAEQRPAG